MRHVRDLPANCRRSILRKSFYLNDNYTWDAAGRPIHTIRPLLPFSHSDLSGGLGSLSRLRSDYEARGNSLFSGNALNSECSLLILAYFENNATKTDQLRLQVRHELELLTQRDDQ